MQEMKEAVAEPKRRLRFRYVYMALGTLLVLFSLFAGDPDVGWIQDLPYGSTFIANNLIALRIVAFVTLFHLTRRALIDYVNLSRFFRRAYETPEGSGLATVAVGLICIGIGLVFIAAALFQ